MKFIFLILLTIVCFSVLYIPISDEAKIMIQCFDYHIEISSILVLILLVILIITLICLIEVISFIKNIPTSLHKYYQIQQERNDLLLLIDGFEALHCCDVTKVQKIVKKVTSNSNHQQLQSIKPSVTLFMIQCYELLDNEDQLETYYQELLHYEQMRMLGFQGLVKLRMKQRLYHDALFYAEKALVIDKKTEWLIKELIVIYMNVGLYEKAENIIKKALGYDFIAKVEYVNLMAKNYVNYANYCISNLHTEKAITLLEKALDFDPACHDAVFTLARLYSQDGKAKRTFKIIEKAWTKQPSIELAKFCLNINQNEKIEKKSNLLGKLIAETPENKAGYLALAELYIEENDIKKARLTMDKLLALHAPDSQMSKIMALIEAKAQNNNLVTNWLYKI